MIPKDAGKAQPWTVYYYRKNSISISDSPFMLEGLFEGSVRSEEFVTYSHARKGFDIQENYLNEAEKAKIGKLC